MHVTRTTTLSFSCTCNIDFIFISSYTKWGYGYSDTSQNEQSSLKISNNDSDAPEYEQDLQNYIAKQNPTHQGYKMIRTCLESFDVAHPEDKEKRHLCLVYEPMREPFLAVSAAVC